MLIPLALGASRAGLTLDLPALPWKRQNDQWHVIHKTGLAPPFARVFIKRWDGEPAPAHALLTGLSGQALPGTPAVLGHAEEGGRHCYAFQCVPGKTLAEMLLGAADPSSLVTAGLAMRVVEQAVAAFQAANQRGHVYTDFCAKNIMLDGPGGMPVLIDLDSAWSHARLAAQKGRPRSTEFDIKFWGLWNSHVAGPAQARPEVLGKTMVLSFAAVWLRAAGLISNPRPDPAAARSLAENPAYDAQRPLWDALRARSRAGFQDYFLLGKTGDAAWRAWQEVFDRLAAGRDVAWDGVHAAAAALAALPRPQPAKAAPVKATPVKPALVSPAPVKPQPATLVPLPQPSPVLLTPQQRLGRTVAALAATLGMAAAGAWLAVQLYGLGLLKRALYAFLDPGPLIGLLFIWIIVPLMLLYALVCVVLLLGLMLLDAGIVVALLVLAFELVANLRRNPASFQDPFAMLTHRHTAIGTTLLRTFARRRSR